ncbi:hypothetical protein GCM10011351_06000 [Paraliobacillus quinghaiensis]|uniref:Sporulation protein YpjB n=1 Tax=Paraliobacillus quinghaiensis TaxID=470815 RepID=A0A917THL1_9BACI|nr:sporulation protein YpjB [Paraliobacillus quinghaiensis]GGM22921.1 hypothetical protein GCM10011351_06000 [Paraliobacillus quinghaiensis]
MRHSKNNKFYYIICFLLLFTFLTKTSQVTYANEKEASSVTFQYERYISEGRYDLARQWLVRHHQTLMNSAKNEQVKNQNVIRDLIFENIDHVTKTEVPKNQKLQKAMSLVIAVNTLENQNNSIWLNSKESLENSVLAVLSKNNVSENELIKIETHWQMLQPTYQIILDDDQYEELKATYNRILHIEEETDKENLQAVFRETQLIDVINPAVEGNYVSFYWMIFIVGGIIIVTLAYVAFKKYKGEKKKKQKQHIS